MSSERQEQNKNTPWWGEHVHRYNTTLQYILSSDKVLDIACGNGFGSYILSQKTNNIVIGGDISKETVCKKNKACGWDDDSCFTQPNPELPKNLEKGNTRRTTGDGTG